MTVCFSCQENADNTRPSEPANRLEPYINLAELGTDYMTWWSYHVKNISLGYLGDDRDLLFRFADRYGRYTKCRGWVGWDCKRHGGV